jgi:hypothetical protein
MKDLIAPVLITGFCTFFAILITIYYKDISSILRFRKRSVKGTWKGQGVERFLGSAFASSEMYEVSMEFQQLGSRIKGKGGGKSSSGEYYEANLRGRMEDEHFIILRARGISSKEFDIAVMFFELDAKGTKLHGYSLANGLTRHGITLSEISLTQVRG